MDDWIDFYDSAHTIYVNARHRDVHFLKIAEDLSRYVARTRLPGAIVLDYGCGEAVHADMVAAQAGRLILVEPAPGVRARLAARFGANPRIEVCAPERLAALPDHSVDLVVMHSVAQYLTAQELDAALVVFLVCALCGAAGFVLPVVMSRATTLAPPPGAGASAFWRPPWLLLRRAGR